MTAAETPQDRAKRAAAEAALDLVEDGMKLGLGTGSTAAVFIRALGAARKGRFEKVICVPTSRETGRRAEAAGLKLATLDGVGWLDLAVDGADEVDPKLDLIKGGGGALLIEKIVASSSDRMVVIADASKRVETLGAFPLPVEVTPFGVETTRAVIEMLVAGYDVDATTSSLRMVGDAPFITDEGNMIVDLELKRIGDATDLAFALNSIPGVVDNGLFISMADIAIFGDESGAVSVMQRPEDAA